MPRTGPAVRPASPSDLPALVELRLANAEAHLALDPDTYRLPQREAVIKHFTAVLGEEAGRNAVLVAEHCGQVLGMVEVLRLPEPPAHQILRPEPSAQIHTVVLSEARGRGVGSALLDAADRWASQHGIMNLSAGIHHQNADAVRFYRRHGYAPSGTSWLRQPAG
ncbi:GNAT family N-acetyltransferase [Micromonospora tarensis]|uniref:GNAT family N-acetyltransferase n=1 Tax=Micromonospora tarensis TaxID=2806100 RepID=A0ABS1YFI0_9ACTN|nr:GNAT family N-acetyltransferase [Micromonospora tarensis]MBM0276172.1 GNAT family N-acetyltransferase [Micromonospora tarensis]